MPAAFEPGADPPGKLVRSRRVAVRADCRHPHRHFLAVTGDHDAFPSHPHGAGDDRVGIVDDGARLAPRRQRAVRLVGAVGKALRGQRRPGGVARPQQLRAGEPEQEQRRIERGDRARDGVRQRAVLDRHVVERAVRLDVLQPRPFGAAIAASAPT